MSKIKIAVVEDEMIIANEICDILEELGYDVIEPCVTYGQAIEMLEVESPDIVLLDIQLAGKKDGIDVAWVIKENYSIPFIFLTSNSDKATLDRAKELNPSAYLVKPFKQEDLYTSIELAINKFETETLNNSQKKLITDALFVKHLNLYHKIPHQDITHLKSEHNYIEIYTKGGQKFVHRSTMGNLIKKLPKNLLHQVQRSYMVNPKYISAINSTFIVVGEDRIPIGRKYRKDLLDSINIA